MSTPTTPWYPMTHDDAERMNKTLELMAINGSGQVSDVQNWKAVQNIVRAGLGEKAFPVGTQFRVEKETSLSVAMGIHTGITEVSIAEETFLAHEGVVGTGIHEFVFDGAAWIYEGAPVRIADFGITVTGTPAEDDEIIVTEAFTEIVWDVVGHKKTDDGIDEFDATATYAVGSLRTHDGYVWVCTTAIGTATAWDASKWQKLYPAGEHRMILLMHDVWYNRPFDNPEALLYIEETIPAGNYKFKVVNDPWVSGDNDKYFYFTTMVEIPAGSQGYTTAGYNVSQEGKQIKFYSGPTSTTVIDACNLSATVIADAVDLGTCRAGNVNDMARAKVGSNNYKESGIRQWLNSKAKAAEWWAAQTKFDGKSSYSGEAGFLHGMDSDFLAVVQDTAVKCCTNNTWELSGWTLNTVYVLVDKFFLASTPEVGFNADTNQGTVWPYYSGAKNVDRIKRDSGSTARLWWLRSPYPSYAYGVRSVLSDGSLYYYRAYDGYSAAAACEIG